MISNRISLNLISGFGERELLTNPVENRCRQGRQNTTNTTIMKHSLNSLGGIFFRLLTWIFFTVAAALPLLSQAQVRGTSSSYDVLHNIAFTPTVPFTLNQVTLTWNHFEHAWVRAGDSKITPKYAFYPVAGQSNGFDPFGTNAIVTTNGSVFNSGFGGRQAQVVEAVETITGPFRRTNTVSATVTNGPLKDAATANSGFNVLLQSTGIRGFNRSWGTASSTNLHGFAYALSKSALKLKVPNTSQNSNPCLIGQCEWQPLWQDTTVGSAYSFDPIHFEQFDATGGSVFQDTPLLIIGGVTLADLNGASMAWQNGVLSWSGVINGELHVVVGGPYVLDAGKGTADIVIEDGVVTQSTATGIFAGKAPPVGTLGDNYAEPMVDTIRFSVNYPCVGDSTEITFSGGGPDVSPTSPGVAVPAPSGLVGWWPGDGDFRDIAGSHPSIPMGGLYFSPGMVADAFYCDGQHGFLDLGVSPALNLPAFTAEMWVDIEPNATDRNGALLAKGTGVASDGGFCLSYSNRASSGAYALNFMVSGGPGQVSTASVPMNGVPSGFMHIAASFDGHVARLYTNGVSAGSGSSIAGMLINTFPLRIGASGSAVQGSDVFWSRIDEVSLYNRVLSQHEILGIHDAAEAGKIKPPLITVQPQSQTAIVGGSVTLTASPATWAVTPVTYQWYKDALPIANATAPAIVLANLGASDAGSYTVVVTDSGGRADVSVPAILTVNPAPPAADTDVPLPPWAVLAMALGIAAVGARCLRNTASPQLR